MDLPATKLMQEEAERQAQLDRLTSLPRSLQSPEPAVKADTSTVSNGSTPQEEGREDDDQDNNIGIDPSEGAYESKDGIGPDFKVEDEDLFDCFGDLDEEIGKLIKAEPASETSFGLHSASLQAQGNQTDLVLKMKPESKWASHMQLITFRKTAANIADEYLRESGLKLRYRSANRGVIRDPDAYRRGVKDGKKIDVHRKRIEE